MIEENCVEGRLMRGHAQRSRRSVLFHTLHAVPKMHLDFNSGVVWQQQQLRLSATILSCILDSAQNYQCLRTTEDLAMIKHPTFDITGKKTKISMPLIGLLFD